MTYESHGKYDRAVPLNPNDFPVLSKPEYEWDFAQYSHEETSVIREAVDNDDLPALREMLRLLGPDVLYMCDTDHARSPALHYAIELGRVAVLQMLLDYRDTLTPEERRVRESSEEEEEKEKRQSCTMRAWGTPLTEACMYARVDVVQLLLERMPDVDVNACDKFGYTPLQVVGRYAQGPPRWTGPDESASRVAIAKMLLAHGAHPDLGAKPHVDGRPGGVGNALLEALSSLWGACDAQLVRFLIDTAGIGVHEGFFHSTARLDGTGINGVADDEGADDYNKPPANERDVYLTPLATAALYRNAAGVKALLDTPGADFTADLTTPSIPPEFRTTGKTTETTETTERTESAGRPPVTTPVPMLPIHAAMVGRPYDILPIAWNFREALEDKRVKATDPAVWEALEVARTAQDAAAHAAYVDACVATVELLTAVAPVCDATINATHTRRVGAHLYQYTPLHLGARFDRLPMLRVLLDRGADPSVPVPHTSRSAFASVFASVHRLCSPQSYVEMGYWASGFPAEETYSAVVQSIDERIGEGMTALLRDLLGPQAGPADGVNEVNATDRDGNTALHWAMGYSLAHATEALLALGAREDAQNLAGEVPTEGTLPTTTRGNGHQREYD